MAAERPIALFFDAFPAPSERFLHREAALLAGRMPIVVAALRKVRSELLPFPVKGVWGDECSVPDFFRSLLSGGWWVRSASLLFRRGPRASAFLLRRPRAFGKFASRLAGVRGVHSMHAGWCGLAAWHVARTLGVPFTFSCHARDVFVQTSLLGFLLGEARAALVCNEAALEHAQSRLGPLADKLTLLRHPAPPLGPLPPDPGGARLLAVGRPVPKKDYPALFDAFRRVREGRPDASLLVLGASEDELPPLPPGASAAGVVPFRRLRDEMRSASLLLYSSRVAPDGDRDGVPNAIVEAMALGLPVAAADAGGVREVVRDGGTGLLVPAGDPAALAAAALRLLSEPPLRARVRTNAADLVRSLFDPDARSAELAAFLEEHHA